MKKILLVMCTLVMISFISHKVKAKETVSITEAQIVQTFCQNSNLYAYVNIPETKVNSSLKVSVTLDDTYYFDKTEPISRFSNTKEKVSYLFLIDISGSMSGYKDNINTFIREFSSGAGTNAAYAIATFGKNFELKCDFTNDNEVIAKTVDSLEYDAKQTSLYSSIISAVENYGKKQRSDGELYNIVIISDGVEEDKNGVTIHEVEKELNTNSVIVHTIGFTTLNSNDKEKKVSEDALKVLGSFARDTLGVHSVIGYDNKTEDSCAEEITGFINNLFRVKVNISNFDKNGGSYSLKLVFSTLGEKSDLFDARGTVTVPSEESIYLPTITGTKQNQEASDYEILDNTIIDDEEKAQSNNVVCGINIYILIVVIAVVILLFLTLYKLKHKKKKPKRNDESNQNSQIYIKIEMISGNCKMKSSDIYIVNELIIGRDKSCDIQLKNKDISKRNSRLYNRDNTIYIEDLNSTNGTAINNIRIFSPNKLRSGDIVSIGSVKIMIKF